MSNGVDKTSKRWIKLTTRTSDAKLMRVAALTGVDRKAVYWSIINWFWYLDDNRDETIVVTESGFHDIAVWTFEPSLLAACAHETVNWLERAGDGLWRPTRPDSHFSQKAKDRATSGRRMSDLRSRSPAVAPDVTPRAQHLSLSSGSESEISISELEIQARKKMRAVCAREKPPDSGDSPFVLALADWSKAARIGWNTACWHAVASWEAQALPALSLPPDPPDALERIVAALRRKGTDFRSVKFALACVRSAVEEWTRTGVPPWVTAPSGGGQPTETPKERGARIAAKVEAELAARNGKHK